MLDKFINKIFSRKMIFLIFFLLSLGYGIYHWAIRG